MWNATFKTGLNHLNTVKTWSLRIKWKAFISDTRKNCFTRQLDFQWSVDRTEGEFRMSELMNYCSIVSWYQPMFTIQCFPWPEYTWKRRPLKTFTQELKKKLQHQGNFNSKGNDIVPDMFGVRNNQANMRHFVPTTNQIGVNVMYNIPENWSWFPGSCMLSGKVTRLAYQT